ncbi:MAG: hypothetical protein ABR499_05550 [Gemmatimonadaceae bacterium]
MLPTRDRLRAHLWYVRQVLSFVDSVTLGVILGAGFGVWNLIATRLDPLAEDTPVALLKFYGPMFALWGIAGFGAARRSGRLLDGVKVGATVAFVTFLVYDLTQFVRVNVFLDTLTQRSDWQNLMARFQQSGYESLRWYVNYVGLTGAPLKILVGTIIGAGTGLIGGFLARLAGREVGPALQ